MLNTRRYERKSAEVRGHMVAPTCSLRGATPKTLSNMRCFFAKIVLHESVRACAFSASHLQKCKSTRQYLSNRMSRPQGTSMSGVSGWRVLGKNRSTPGRLSQNHPNLLRSFASRFLPRTSSHSCSENPMARRGNQHRCIDAGKGKRKTTAEKRNCLRGRFGGSC